MRASREAVLAAVRASLAARSGLPGAPGPPGGASGPVRRAADAAAARSPAPPPLVDPREHFAAALGEAGGALLPIAREAELAPAIAARHPGVGRVLSSVPGVASRGPVVDPGADPHACAALELTIAAGRFAVAENGAVWVEEADPVRAAALFLAEHLVLVVRAADLLGDMHDAYTRLAAAPMPDWGCFVAGPSKTADIEQCLVIGAHGPRSLAVALVG